MVNTNDGKSSLRNLTMLRNNINSQFLRRFTVFLLLVSLLIFFIILPWIHHINRIRFIGAVLTYIVTFWCLYCYKDLFQIKLKLIFDSWHPWRQYIESRAELIMVVFVMSVICWSGVDIFTNPYLYDYNHGNGAYFSQIMHNLCSGLGPEHTVKYNAVLFFNNNTYYYASIFSVVPHIFPLMVLSPLYCLYPNPPMHIFVVVISVFMLGSLGTYLAVRALEASKTVASLSSIIYCILPWVERTIFMQGHFDTISYAIYPYIFASLFAKRWFLFYCSIFILAIINLPYTFSVIGFGIVTAVFFKAYRHGAVAIVIGILVMLWDMSIIKESLSGIGYISTQPSITLMEIIHKLDFMSVIKAISFHFVYMFLLLMTVSFIPLLGIRRDGQWHWPLIGVLLFAAFGAVMGLFRSYGIDFQRNANMVVPIYLSTFMVLARVLNFGTNTKDRIKNDSKKNILIIFGLFAGIVSMTLWFSNHYPWAGITDKGIMSLRFIKSSQTTDKYKHILLKMKEYIPEDASVAYRIDAALQAFITNRQKAWYLGYHPEGVEYYFIQTKEVVYIDLNLKSWQEYMKRLEENKNLKVIYKDAELVIYKNLNPQPIPRLESVLGWDILLKALLPKQCNINH